MVLINPELSNQGEEIKWKEGCLSLPDLDAHIVRSETTLVKYTSENGETKRLIAEWPFSGGLQHECDHLDGILYIDRVEQRTRSFLDEYNKYRANLWQELSDAEESSESQ